MIGSQLTDWLTDCLTAYSGVLVKVIVPWLTIKLSTFYQTQSFTMFARAATCPCPEPDQSSPCLPSCVSWKSVLMLSTLLCLGLPNGLSLLGFPNKSYAKFISPCMLHTPHISAFVWFLLFIPLKPFPFRPRYHSQHPNLKHPQPMFLPPCETRFHTHIKQHARL